MKEQRKKQRRVAETVNLKDSELIFIGYREFKGDPGGLAPMYSTECRREERRKHEAPETS